MTSPVKPLTRATFRTGVFDRDRQRCVVPGCGNAAEYAHHIIERRLWLKDDPLPEGYDLNNGASLCELHHLHAEAGYFPPQALRHWLDIPTILPAMMNPLKIYDKWGNEIPSVGPEIVKYPKTPYLPFSPSVDREDRVIDIKNLLGKPLVVTTKMDGSCVTLTKNHVGARNALTAGHPSFNLLKAKHAQFKDVISDNMQLFGEWLLAEHSIKYQNQLALKDYLQIFAIYDQYQELFFDWLGLEEFCTFRGLTIVPIIAEVTFTTEWQLIAALTEIGNRLIKDGHEGFVVKSKYPFHYTQFSENVAKYVRANHVQTTKHWTKQQIVKNQLKDAK